MLKAAVIREWLYDRKSLAVVAGGLMWAIWFIWAIGSDLKWIDREPEFMDHMAFYSAAKLIQQNQPERIYDYEFLQTYQMQLIGRQSPLFSAYRNPPFYALLYYPTCTLTYTQSYWIWNAISILCVIFSCRLIWSEHWVRFFVIACLFNPVFATISFGQNSLISLFIFCCVYRLLQKQLTFAAGVMAALILFKPQLVLIVGCMTLIDFHRLWRCILGFMTGSFLLIGSTWLMLPEAYHAFIQQFRTIAAFDAFDYWNQHNSRGFFSYLFGDDRQIGQWAGSVISLFSFLLFLPLLRKYRHDLPIWYSLMIFATLWVSPHAMIYEWSLLLLPACLLWQRFPRLRNHLFVVYSVVCMINFISTPLAKFQLQQFGWGIQFITIFYLISLILILVWIRKAETIVATLNAVE